MKKIIITLYIITAFALVGMTQDCVPIFGLTTAGIYPSASTANCMTQGVDTELVITLKNFDFVLGYTVDSVIIDSITNIPCALKYAIFPRSKRLLTAEAGCIRIHGASTDAIGQYKIKIFVKIYGTPDIPIYEGQSTALDFLGGLHSPPLDLRYWVRIKGPGACNALDTSSTSTINRTATCKAINNTGVNEIISSYTDLNVSPNPVQSNMNVRFEADNNNAITYSISTITGQTLQTSDFSGQVGLNSIDINVSNLVSGTYFITLKNGISSITKPFVKE